MMLQRSFLAVGSAIVSRLSAYLVLIVVARLLAPESFGVFAVLAVVATVLNAVVSGGGDMWLNRFTWSTAPRLHRAPHLWRFYIVIATVLAGLVISLVFLAVHLFPRLHEYGPAIILAAGWAVVAGLAEAFLAIFRASDRTRLFFIVRDLVAPLGMLIAVVVLHPRTAAGTFEIFLFVWGAVLIGLFAALLPAARTMLPWVRARRGLWRHSFAHTLSLVYGNLGSRLAVHVDMLALAGIISLTQVGEYRVAAQIAVGFIVVQHFMFLALPWQLRRVGSPLNPGTGHASVIWRQRLLLGMAFAALVALSVLAGPILSLFGERFTAVADIFRILLVIRFASLLWGPQHEILVSAGHVTADANANLAALGAWLATFFLAIEVMSPMAAALVANAAGSLVGQGMRYRMIADAGLRHVAGHGFGPALPAACTALTAVAAMAVL